MTDTPDPSGLSAVALIDRLCDAFERGWAGGAPARIEEVVAGVPEPVRPELFRELLAVEQEFRARDRRPLTADEARRRFAGLGPWAEAAVGELLAPSTGSWAAGVETTGPDPEPASSPAAGLPAAVGKFRVLRELGGGGMGIVYLAEDPHGRRQVAVKVMRPKYAADPTARERFLREARSAMAVEHDHIVPVYQVEENDGRPFLVMPALKGESLQDRLDREPLPPLDLVLKVGREIALGLTAAHDRGLVHRDVKPANTWLEGDPAAAGVRRVKVLDFGLARAADHADGVSLTGAVVGTPQYMAPEQADGRPVDGRADLFSLGAVLYRMAAGRPAFGGPTTSAVLTAVATHTPPSLVRVNPAVPPALSHLIDRLLAKDPARRPGSAAEVAAALTAIDPARPAPRPWRRRAAVLAALVLVTTGVGTWLATRPPPTGSPQAADPPAAVAIRYRVRVDVLVERGRRLVRLDRPGALPLKADDGFAIEATTDPPGYLYVVWVDPGRDVTPVYPWNAEDGWEGRPPREEPTARARVPTPGKLYYAAKAKPGVATIVAFARPTPLDVPGDEVWQWFESLPELDLAREDHGAAVWFDDYRPVTGDADRRGTFATKVQSDPFADWQGRLSRLLGDRAAGQSAVSFARTGRK